VSALERSLPARRARLAILVLALAPSGCKIPRFQGPQIQSPPPAFSIKDGVAQDRRMFPDRDLVFHTAWIESSWGNFSGIYINGHPGVIGPDEVEAARAAAIEAVHDQLVKFGDLEATTVDGRTAWGWGEEWRLPDGGLRYMVFRTAIPYDTVTYTVEFVTGDPGLKIRPDSLRTIAASFAIGRTEWNIPLIVICLGALALLVSRVRARDRARVERARHVTLVHVPEKEKMEQESAPSAGPTDSPGT